MKLAEILKDNAFFSQLKEHEILEVEAASRYRTYQRGEILVHQGDIWPFLFLVVEGEINAVKESIEGRELIAATIGPDDIFWGLAFFIQDAPMPVLLQINSTAKVYLWDRADLVPVIRKNGGLAWKLCLKMINRMQLASAIVEDLAFQPVMSRLAGLLIDISEDADGDVIARQLTLDEMAARIGSTREMVCRHLYRFAENGLIEISRTEFKIKDREKLRARSRPS